MQKILRKTDQKNQEKRHILDRKSSTTCFDRTEVFA